MDSMMDSKKAFLVYDSWMDLIKQYYPDDSQKQKDICFAIWEYGYSGNKTYPCEPMFLDQVFVQIDSAKSKWSKRVEAGRKGGLAGKGTSRNTGNKNAKKQKQNNSKTIHNDNVNDNDNENDNIININNVNEILPSSRPLEGTDSEGNFVPYKQKVFEGGYYSAEESFRRWKEGMKDE